jgi:hypothetical protein
MRLTKQTLTISLLLFVNVLNSQITTKSGQFNLNRLTTLKEVTYVPNNGLTIVKDDITHGELASKWSVDEPTKNNPISYCSGSKIKLKAKFDIACNGFNVDFIRIQPYFEATESTPAMKFPVRKPNATMLNQGKYELEYLVQESNKAFTPNTICYVENFGPKWKISYDEGNTFEDMADKSSNELYVTWKKPKEENSGSSLSPYFHLHTLFHITCKPFNNITLGDINELTDAFWKTLFAVDIVGINNMLYRRKDNLPLKYYGTYGTNTLNCPDLIKTGDGQCNSFAQLFIQLLRIHGYLEPNSGVDVYASNQTSPICGRSEVINDRTLLHFMVKRWYFINTPTNSNLPNCQQMPYHIITLDNGNGNTISEWHYISGTNIPTYRTFGYIQDDFGVQGQNSSNPEAWFKYHSIVKIGSIYYDPSYGVKYADSNDFRANYLDGWSVVTKNLSEIQLGYDVNGDGIIGNTKFHIWSATNNPNLFTINFE